MTIIVEDIELPMRQVLTAIHEGCDVLVIPDGRTISLAHPAFSRFQKLISQAALLPEKERIAINRLQSGWVDELTEGHAVELSDEWKKSIEVLKDQTKITPITTPKTLKATLRSYQKEGFSWLVFLRMNRLGGVLGDEMGLGKTVQSIAYLCYLKSLK